MFILCLEKGTEKIGLRDSSLSTFCTMYHVILARREKISTQDKKAQRDMAEKIVGFLFCRIGKVSAAERVRGTWCWFVEIYGGKVKVKN